jgi:hypothetical protein
MQRFFLLTIFFLMLTAFRPHAYHVSLTEMRHNAKEKIYEVEIKVFTDDLEKALLQETKSSVRLSANDKNDTLIAKYLAKRFKIFDTKNNMLTYTVLGKEIEKDATWIFVELPVTEPSQIAKIEQGILTELYDDQSNVLNIFRNAESRSYIFNTQQKLQAIVF